ncbi:MAG TPA: MMPL family transporter [Cellvibrio sp.]|nr:MMPL family transporter [Cellvibrio sp.]
MIDSHFFAVRVQPIFKWVFGLLTILMVGLLSVQLYQGISLETNLQALFPQDENDRAAEKINEQLTHEFGNKLLIAVQAKDSEEVKLAAELLSQAIAKNPLLHIASLNESAQVMEQQQALLQQYRYQLLTSTQQQQLQQKQFAPLLSHAQAALFGFNPSANTLTPLQDPLNINPAFLQQLQPALNGELVNDHLLLADGDGQLILFALSMEGESFNVDLQENINEWLAGLRAQLATNMQTRNTQVLVSGVVFHAADASSRAKKEMNLISVGDVLACVILYLLTFFRVKPLLLTLASVVYGFGLALACNIWLFGKIHIMTLVFGTSLIGVAIDYSVHYLCKHQQLFVPGSDRNTSNYIIQKLLPALTLGFLASIVGYACLLQPSLPGLKQIASFSIIGLTGAWLFVVVTYPLLVNKVLPKPHAFVDRCAFSVWRFWAGISVAAKRGIFVVLFLVTVIGWLQFQFSSDIRTLYKPSAELMYSEQRLQQVLQGVSPNQYFLLRAADPESLLQAEEDFRRTQLDPLVAKGALKDYTATSLISPSQRQQQQSYELLRETFYSDSGLASQFMLSAGFKEEAVRQAQQEFFAAEGRRLDSEAWLNVARADQRLLWLGKIDNDFVSIIGLRGVSDLAALAAAANGDTIRWVNRVSEMSSMLQELTHSAAAMLLLAYGTTLVILWFSYRTPRALLLISVPLMSTLLTLSLLSLGGVQINLFHIFGCYLILGLGMDYSIFSYAEGLQDKISQRSIWLSAMTSGVSFGLLGFSSTPMVQAFGLTLLLGCLLNLWFAPLVGNLKPRPVPEIR